MPHHIKKKVAAESNVDIAAPLTPLNLVSNNPVTIATRNAAALAVSCDADLPLMIIPGKKIYKLFRAIPKASTGTKFAARP